MKEHDFQAASASPLKKGATAGQASSGTQIAPGSMFGWVVIALLAGVSLSLSVLAAEPPSPPGTLSSQQAVASTPAAKVLRYCRRLVEKYDRNADGRLQENEWAEMLLERYDKDGDRRLGPDEWDETRVKRYDSDRDGSLDEEERRRIWKDQWIEMLFSRYNRDGDKQLGPHEWDAVRVEGHDLDGDGALNEAEWRRMWRSLASSRSEDWVSVEDLAGQITAFKNPIVMPARSTSSGKDKSASLLNPATGVDASGEDDDSKAVSKQGDARGAARARRATKFFVPRSQLPRGLPAWFLQRDADGDGQLTMLEFAPKATQSQIDDFASYDHNGDGVITAKEGARGPKRTGKQRAEQAAQEEAAEEPDEDTMEEPAEETEEEPA